MTKTSCLERLHDLSRRFSSQCNGNIAAIFAIAIIPIVVAVGAAIDFAKSSEVKSQLQKSIDAAVLAGVTQASTTQISTASSVFTGDYSGKYGTTASATFTQNGDGSLAGTATSSVSTSFLNVIGMTSLGVTASATAKPGPQTKTPVCILLVSTLKSQSLLVNSGAVLNAPTCEVHVLSTQSPAAIFNTTLNAKRICIKGSTIIKNGGANPPAVTNCATITDPYAGTLPAVDTSKCDVSVGQTYNPNTTVTLPSGVYCAGVNFNGSAGTIKLSGTYILKNSTFIINSGWTVSGSGVTFYFADQNSKIQFNGTVDVTLSAPTSGTYANVLMYEPTGLSTSQWVFNGSNASSYTGLIYLPSRDVTFNSTSNMTSTGINMVFNTLILDKTNWAIAPGALAMSVASGTAGSAYLSR